MSYESHLTADRKFSNQGGLFTIFMNIHPVHTADVQGFNVGYGLLQRDHIFLLADSLFSITENVVKIISAIS